MTACSSQVAVPPDCDPYWVEVLEGSGFGVGQIGDVPAPVALLLPDKGGTRSPALRTLVERLRRLGTPLVCGAEWGGLLLGQEPRSVRGIGISGRGGIFTGVSSVRMPGRFPLLAGANFGRIWPGGEAAVVLRAKDPLLCVLPLPDAQRLLGAGAELTAFPCGEASAVHEVVARVDHGGVRRLVLGALREVCRAARRPLVRKATAPAGYSSTFAFRVDADGFDLAATRATLAGLAAAALRATWFVDVERHLAQGEAGKQAIHAIAAAGHEVQSHYFHHYTYRDARANERNLRRSLAELAELGIVVNAAAAPFGTWNQGLDVAVRRCGLAWTSEFSRSYDDVVSKRDGRKDSLWQVAVHPVCPKLLLDRGLSESQIQLYFAARVTQAFERGDPAVLYGHPIGELERLPGLLFGLGELGAFEPGSVWRPTLSRLVEFEAARRAQPLELSWDGRLLSGESPGPAGLLVQMPDAEPESSLPRATDPTAELPKEWQAAALRSARWRGRRLRLARLAREIRR